MVIGNNSDSFCHKTIHLFDDLVAFFQFGLCKIGGMTFVTGLEDFLPFFLPGLPGQSSHIRCLDHLEP